MAEKLNEVYLGDGLYASFDGYMFILRTPREHGDHWIGLEPDVLQAFNLYRANCILKYRNAFGRSTIPTEKVDG
jgi:hypothetical protein